MQLIYRGHSYTYTPAEPQLCRTHRAINWRFQAPGETYDNSPVMALTSQQPRTMNWRYQMAMNP